MRETNGIRQKENNTTLRPREDTCLTNLFQARYIRKGKGVITREESYIIWQNLNVGRKPILHFI